MAPRLVAVVASLLGMAVLLALSVPTQADQANLVYLPLVFNPLPTSTQADYLTPTPTETLTVIAVTQTPSEMPSPTETLAVVPTATPTLTPTVSSCGGPAQAVLNPGFENGGTSWSASVFPSITNAYAEEGQYSVWLGGYNNASDSISQGVVVPSWATTATLTFWWLMTSTDAVLYQSNDYLYAGVVGPNGVTRSQIAVIDNTYNRGIWFERQLAIDQVAGNRGQVFTVGFTGTTDAANPTSWYVDNVQLTFGC